MLVHSGERPFSCERCGQTFTTNGNMHRHKRTHGVRDSRESDGSSGTSSNGGGQRGRAGRKRKTSMEQASSQISSLAAISTPPTSASLSSPIESSKMMQHLNNKKNDVRNILGLSSVGNLASPVPSGHAKCPICHETFFSEISLAAHVDSAHRGQDIQCDECNNIFPGYSYLKLHKNIYHHKSLASFPLHALQQGLAGFPSMMTSTPTPAKMEFLHEIKEKIEPKKEEKILDLSSPIKLSKSIFNTSTDDLSIKDSSEYDQDYDKEFDDNEDLIRDMKLKGEFPCRICPAVYPNLRALKGHNKEHMDKPPYICNVAACTYASNDKSTLARHMRTHTGEKPFECTLCNFGFTTKANCERHIKNKHGKLSREEVRDAIVVHEVSDDKLSSSGGDRNMMNTSMTESNSSFRDESPNGSSISPTKKRRKSGSLVTEKKTPLTFFAPYHSSLFRPASEEKKVEHEDAPLDLSRPVPEQTKEEILKKHIPKEIPTEMPLPASYPSKMANSSSTMDFTKSLAAAVSAAQFQQGLHSQMPFPFLFSHFASAAATGQLDITAYLLAQQETIRRQRELEIAAAQAALAPKDPTSLLLHLSNLQSLSSRNFAADVTMNASKVTSAPLSAPSPPENRPFSYFSESNKDRSDSESDYKMVIKNGVLMKKQKQRRYRTERPYECEKCSARFTLRSNMERHVKQQHAGGPNDMSNLGISNGKEADMYQREDDDRDDMEDSENEDGAHEFRKMQDDGQEDDEEINVHDDDEEEEEEGVDLSSLEQLVSGSGCTKPFHTFFDTTEDEDESEGELTANGERKLSAYSAAPNKIPCPFCGRMFPWTSSLKRHILTHTGDKPYKCPECPLWFTTKSNCDRHLVRKHSNNNNDVLGIRNIPERPYKCQMCPSSTFSSQSNLRKHQHSKHRVNNNGDAYSSSSNEEEENTTKTKAEDCHNDSKESASSGMSETPYKCHLCEDGFSEREEAISHLQKAHQESYQLLITKGAFEIDQQPLQIHACEEENFDQLRGKFPDYINRKVICMFCTRKFWSAEDLRRHVRTHTGERPYSCDICQRTFTLKHSMLRHRKKHDSGVSSGGEVSESESEQGSAEVRSTYTSSVGGGRSSPEEEAAKAAHISHLAVSNKTDIKKKRANLMDKINQLSSSVNHNDPSMLSQNISS